MQTVPRLLDTFVPRQYDVSLTLEREARSFSGTTTIHGTTPLDATNIKLHSKDLTIDSVTFDGKAASWETGEFDELTITHQAMKPGDHIVVVSFHGTITDPMHGLYPCYFEVDGVKKELLATQFESHHAREVFPCIDEPAAKAVFNLTLTTEQGVTVLGNQPIARQVTENDRLVTTFEPTPRMSTYLLAWVVGELHSVSAKTKNGVEVNVWATEAQPSESLTFALDIATRTIDFFDEYFGVAYPLAKSDHVALPDFSSGAMENWGLITYREVALLAHPKTTSVSMKRYVATVIAHELSHQWFGNLVTMQWWDDLWLNESFATLMEYIAVDALHPEWNVWLDFAAGESVMALRRDALDGVQSVKVEVHHPDEITTLFDGAIVYAKGARLLRMVQHYLGDEAFQQGLRNYFNAFAYQNTVGGDLWSALADASGKDIVGMMNTWVSQPGYPVVHVTTDGLEQRRFFIGPHTESDATWPIPLGVEGEEMPDVLYKRNVAFPIDPSEQLNIAGASHFVTHYAPDFMTKRLEAITSGSSTPIDRLQLLNEQTLLARGAVISSAELIPLLQAYQNETAESVWDIMALTIGELKKFIETDRAAETKLKQLVHSLVSPLYDKLGWEPAEGESEEDIKLRATIVGLVLYAEDTSALTAAEQLFRSHTLSELNPELRASIISAFVRHFATPEDIDSLIAVYRAETSPNLQNDIVSGLTSAKDSGIITTLLDLLTDTSTIRTQDTFRWFAYLVRNRYARDAAWDWLVRHWSWIEDQYGGDKSFDDFPQYAAGGLVTREQLQNYRDFFEPKRSIPALTRVIDLGVKEIEGRIDLIERDGDDVRRALQ